MTNRSLMRRLAVVTAAALAAATLTSPPAHALPVFGTAEVQSGGGFHDDGSCAVGSSSVTPSSNTPVVENGPAVTATSTASGSVNDGGTDVQNATASVTGTGSIKSAGTDPKSISFTANGAVSVTNTVVDSVCKIHAYANAEIDFAFTVTRPMFLTFTNKVRGTALYTEFYMYADTVDSPYHDDYGSGIEIDTSQVLYLTPGDYSGYFSTEAGISTDRAFSDTSKATMLGTFVAAGSQTAAPAGKGKRYVSLPATGRSCATDTLTGAVTSNGKRAKTIKQVSVFVNGTKVKNVKKPGKGDAVVVSGLSDGAAADVRVVAKLTKKANGKARKPAVVTAVYAACTPAP